MTALVPENQQQYGSILTIAGENAEQNSKVLKQGVEITHIAFGDANDTYVQPYRNATSLVNEIGRIEVNAVDVQQATPDSVPMLRVEAILPPELGNIVIREFAAVATFNGNTFFHAIGNCARVYVPEPVNNGNMPNPVTLEMFYVITSGEAIVEIDPRVVHASREWVSKAKDRPNNRDLQFRLAEKVNVYDYLPAGVIPTGDIDYADPFESAISDLKKRGGGKLVCEDLGFIVRLSRLVKFDIDKIELDISATFGPFGTHAGFLTEITTSKDDNPFFDGADWLWPKSFKGKLKFDCRSPDLKKKQSKACKLSRLAHNVLDIFVSYGIRKCVWVRGCIESDLYFTFRLSGEVTATYVTHNGLKYCCVREHVASELLAPDLEGGADYWVIVPDDASDSFIAWSIGLDCKNGSDGAPLWLYDLDDNLDSNNNLRIYGVDVAYSHGSMLLIDNEKTFGTRNIFFFGPQIHHQDQDITGSEGDGQPNYPGPNHSPAAANQVSHGVGAELRNCYNVHFFGGNIRKGQTAGGTLMKFGDKLTNKPVRGVVFHGTRFSGEGDNLTGFDFDNVQLDNNHRGVSFPLCEFAVDSGVNSQLYKGDGRKVSFGMTGHHGHNVLGDATDTAYDVILNKETYARFAIRNDGTLIFGDGVNPVDTNVKRPTPGAFISSGVMGGEKGIVIGEAGYFHNKKPLGEPIGTYRVEGSGGGLRGYVPLYADKEA